MVAQQTPGVTHPVELPRHLTQQPNKPPSILVILVDRLPPIPTRSHVLERVGELQAEGAGHVRETPSDGGLRYRHAPFRGRSIPARSEFVCFTQKQCS